MKCFSITTDNFTFECETIIFEKDTSLPLNSILNININSDNFTASTTMDIDIKAFNLFLKELLNVYNSLKGSAVLKEPYGSNYIEFHAKSNGHIYVKGSINNLCRNGFEQQLLFENEFDQTFLKDFADCICKYSDD